MRRVLQAVDGERTVSEIVDELTRPMSPDDPQRARIEDEVRAAVRDYAG